MCQSFHDGRLSRTRFADKNGVVLGAPAQDLQHTPDFLVAPDYGVQLACACLVHQVAGILAEALISVLAALRGSLLSAPQLTDGCCEFLFRHAGVLEYLACIAAHREQCLQEGLQGHKFVAGLLGQVFGLQQHLVSAAAQVGFSTLHLGQGGYLCVHGACHGLLADAQFLEDELRHLLAHLQNAAEQVLRLDGLLPLASGAGHCFLHGLLRLDCKFVQVHNAVLFLCCCCTL